MNLNHLKDQQLLTNIKTLVYEETRVTTEILWHLMEVESRHLHLRLSYSSLFDYCVRELKYSETSANRRIASMRLLRSVPAIESQVRSGELSLSTLTAVQTFLKQEKKHAGKTYDIKAKEALINEVAKLPLRQVEKILASKSEAFIPHEKLDKQKPISGNGTLISFVADAELVEMLARLKEITACPQDTNPNLNKLLKKAVGEYLKRHDPANATGQRSQPVVRKKSQTAPPAPDEKTTTNLKRSRYITAADRRAAFARSSYQCEYCNPATGNRCQARSHLQVEHKMLFAFGGSNTLENLEILCANHNRMRAVEKLGQEKMARYYV